MRFSDSDQKIVEVFVYKELEDTNVGILRYIVDGYCATNKCKWVVLGAKREPYSQCPNDSLPEGDFCRRHQHRMNELRRAEEKRSKSDFTPQLKSEPIGGWKDELAKQEGNGFDG